MLTCIFLDGAESYTDGCLHVVASRRTSIHLQRRTSRVFQTRYKTTKGTIETGYNGGFRWSVAFDFCVALAQAFKSLRFPRMAHMPVIQNKGQNMR